MVSIGRLVSLAIGLVRLSEAWNGRTKTLWDCCKPSCAWRENLQTSVVAGSVKVCDKDDFFLSNGPSVQSSCRSDNPGNGFLCSDFQPRPVSSDLTYAFVAMSDLRDCCRCFELTWLGGPSAGRRLQVQMINAGTTGTDVAIEIPGGGVEGNYQGCELQYGYDWGRIYGGVTRVEECAVLPDRLQGGCYWRFNWAKGDINDWPVDIRNISCPSELTSVSGCESFA